MSKYIRAKWALPISSPPIEDAIIGIHNGRIHLIGSYVDLHAVVDGPIEDLGDTVVLPGFVNAHCHLELGAGRYFSEKTHAKALHSFTEWIRDVLTFKSTLTQDDEKEGVTTAAASLLKSGVTAIADHISADGPIHTVLTTPFRGRLFIELLGPNLETATHCYQNAKRILTQHRPSSHWHCHITPHSAHALHPTLLEKSLRDDDFFSIHLAESKEEVTCFSAQSGPLFNLLCSRADRPQWKGSTSLAHLAAIAPLSHPLLVVHGNIITETDLNLLNPNRHRFVHCPGSHAYFNHPRFPLELIESRGFLVALGTDSWASNHHQNFLEEMRRFQTCYPTKTPADVIRHATLIGAYALGLNDDIGSIEIGKCADLIGFPFVGTDPHDAVLSAREISWRHPQNSS